MTYLDLVAWGVSLSWLFLVSSLCLLLAPHIHAAHFGSSSFVGKTSSRLSGFVDEYHSKISDSFSAFNHQRFSQARLVVAVPYPLLSMSREGGLNLRGFRRTEVIMNSSGSADTLTRVVRKSPSSKSLVFVAGRFTSGEVFLEQANSGQPFTLFHWLVQGQPLLFGLLSSLDRVPLLRNLGPDYLRFVRDDWRSVYRVHEYLAELDSTFSGDVVVVLDELLSSDFSLLGGSRLGWASTSSTEESSDDFSTSLRMRQVSEMLKRLLDRFDFGDTLFLPLAVDHDSPQVASLLTDGVMTPSEPATAVTFFDLRRQQFLTWSEDVPCHFVDLPRGLDAIGERDFLQDQAQSDESGIPRSKAGWQRAMGFEPTLWCLLKSSPQTLAVSRFASRGEGSVGDGDGVLVEGVLEKNFGPFSAKGVMKKSAVANSHTFSGIWRSLPLNIRLLQQERESGYRFSDKAPLSAEVGLEVEGYVQTSQELLKSEYLLNLQEREAENEE